MTATSRPTSRDVAHEAGVSQSTVSLVLGGKWAGRVSPATVAAVQAAAERLGYRPNPAARSLRLGTTRTVMLMVPTLTAPFFGSVYAGAAREAVRHGLGVVVYPWPDDAGPADSPFATPHEAIDGILASSMPEEVVERFHGTPVVMLDSDPAGRFPTVNFGVADGMRALVAHLAGLGHRRFGHVAATVNQWTFHIRHAALAAAVAEAGGTLARAAGALDIAAAKDAAGRLLDAAPDPAARPTALVCDDDLMAAGAYKAARARGLEVPADLSVTGMDDVLLATALEPELTTVRLPAEELGAEGMRSLLTLLNGTRPEPRTLPGELVVRASTRAPGR
ncbi:LacI family DNA-binding transcriptional regulator [Actinomadura kijaniata]|uniref:LacI family DNA-binding transcriptional regulator n=1 Tax=Actinomadura kijaniata TaxID=46161 RepID=UPI003F1A779A